MQVTSLQGARILIADDEEANVRFLERLLARAGYRHVASTTDSRQIVPLYLEFQPDLILLDLLMPHIDGFAIMAQMQQLIPQGSYLPILVLTADVTQETRQRALSGGANDFLTKPLDATEVVLRVRNLLESRFLHLQLQAQNQNLEERVRERTEMLEHARIEILERLGLAAEFRDDETGQHTRRVGRLAAALAKRLGLPQEEVDLIRRAAPLHDVGKIGIRDAILLKPGKLTDEEFEIIKCHTTLGARLLAGSGIPVLNVAEQIALSHHERWDGRGYPRGLAGEEIPLVGRITAVADVFDVITHDRPYKVAQPVEAALEELERQAGHQFDPNIVATFIPMIEQSYETHEGLPFWEEPISHLVR